MGPGCHSSYTRCNRGSIAPGLTESRQQLFATLAGDCLRYSPTKRANWPPSTDDVYSLFKRFVRWVFGRGKRANQQAAIVAAVGTESTATTPAVDASKPAPLLSNHSPTEKGQADAKPTLSTARGDYFAFEYFTTDDIAKLYRVNFREHTTNQRRSVVVKIAREADASPAMQNEVSILRELQRDSGAHGKHLPGVVDQFRTAEGNASTVFDALDGQTLQQLRQRFPAGIEPRHVSTRSGGNLLTVKAIAEKEHTRS